MIRKDQLVFESEPLDEELVLLGPVDSTIYLNWFLSEYKKSDHKRSRLIDTGSKNTNKSAE